MQSLAPAVEIARQAIEYDSWRMGMPIQRGVAVTVWGCIVADPVLTW